MIRSRILLAIPVCAILALVIASPVAGDTRVGPAQGAGGADHVDPADCDAITVEGGQILVNGTALTPTQVASLGLTDGALELAAAASAQPGTDVCVDVAGLPGTPVVNGHIDFCGAVDADLDVGFNVNAVILVGGVTVADGTRTVDTIEALQVADVANVDACVSVDIVSTQFVIQATPSPVCVTATLRADGTLDLVIGQTEMTLGDISGTDLNIVDWDALLTIDQAAEAKLALTATADFDIHAGTFVIEVSEAVGCSSPSLPDAAMERSAPASTALGALLIVLAGMLRLRRRHAPSA